MGNEVLLSVCEVIWRAGTWRFRPLYVKGSLVTAVETVRN